MTSVSRRACLGAVLAGLSSGVRAKSGYSLLENKPLADGRPGGEVRVFEASAGESVQAVLSRWAQQSGWKPPAWPVGKSPEVTLNENVYVEGDFATAVRVLFREHRGLRQRSRPELNLAQRTLKVLPKLRD